MNQPRTYARIVATVLLAGCAACATAGTQQPATGHVTGRLVMEGGPMGPGGTQPGERPMSGTVTFTADGHRVVSVEVGPSGTFSVPLPPGRYQVSGRSPDIMAAGGGTSREQPCAQQTSATVTAGQIATVTLVCVIVP